MGSASSVPSSPSGSNRVETGSEETSLGEENVILKAEVARLKIKVSNLHDETIELRSSAKSQADATRDARADRKKLRAEVQRLRNDLRQASAKTKTVAEKIQKEEIELEQEIRELKSELDAGKEERERLESRLASSVGEVKTLKKALEKSLEGSPTETEIEILRDKVAALEETLRAYEQITSPGHMATKARIEFFPVPRYEVGARVATKLGYRGVVRFCGEVKFATGIWVGLELDSAHRHADDLSLQRRRSSFRTSRVQGVTYFDCDEDRGLFVRAEDVIVVLRNGDNGVRRKVTSFKSFRSIVLLQILFRRFLKRKRLERQRRNQLRATDCGYKELDDYALSAPTTISLTALPDHFKRHTTNERSLARLVFRWITANIEYDAVAYFSGGSGNDDDLDVIYRTRKSVCSGFARLFKALAQAVGLEAHSIRGYSKGYGYRAGDTFKGKQPSHAWNSVKIDGHWHLVDVTWASGHIGDKCEFVRRFNDYYFLTPPSQFVLDHYPIDDDWQLLSEPIRLNQFELMLTLGESFFENRLEVVSHPNAVIDVNRSGQVDVVFGNRENAMLLARLYRLDAGSGADAKSRVEVPHGVLVQTRDSRTTCVVPFPKAGRYELRLYVKGRTMSGNFSHFATYKITCHNAKRTYRTFPEIYSDFQKISGYLHSPLSGALRLGDGKAVGFRVDVPGAVQVVVQPGWNALKREKTDEFTWTGEVTFGEVEDYVSVFAQFDEDSNRYSGLLKYRVEKKSARLGR